MQLTKPPTNLKSYTMELSKMRDKRNMMLLRKQEM